MAKADQIRNQILTDIESGTYPPGTRLPSRHELMARYGVARATIDRVIRTLCADGTLASTQGSGTFVASATSPGHVAIYIILNTDISCIADGMMEREWNFILNETEARQQSIILGGHELEKFLPAIRSNPNARLIWNRPSMRSHVYIEAMNAAGRAQVLINRAIPRYNFVATDQHDGIRRALEHVRTVHPTARIAILPPCINPELHYLAAREIHFLQEATRMGLTIIPVSRAASPDHGGTLAIVAEALDKKPDFLYVPDHYMTPYVVSLMHERGLRSGRDISLITSDWNESPTTTPGLICLRQQWRTMFQATLKWVREERPGKIQARVPPEMTINPA